MAFGSKFARAAALVALVMAGALALAGCGQGESSSSATNPTAFSNLSASSSTSSSSASSSASSSTSASASTSSAASSQSSSAAANVQTYTNTTFGYSFPLLDGFEIEPASAREDGAIFNNKNLNMSITVSAYNNTDNMTTDKLIDSLRNGSEDIVREVEGEAGVLFQRDDTNAYYYLVYVGTGSINRMDISYPLAGQSIEQEDAVRTILTGFAPGDLSVSH